MTATQMTERLARAHAVLACELPGQSGARQPVHTVYGGAHLFKSDTAKNLGLLALKALHTYGDDAATFAGAVGVPPGLAETVYQRLVARLTQQAVEDFRIDFEDGYGYRADSEEDSHAIGSAEQTGRGYFAGTLPPVLGIRIKPLSDSLHLRAIRTLDLFLGTLSRATSGKLPDNFAITLPKVTTPVEVACLADLLDSMETLHGFPRELLRVELMVETPLSLCDPQGNFALPKLIAAARGRCRGLHFGAYDYTSACGISASEQRLDHPACDFARSMMQVASAGCGLWLSDGAFNVLPVAPHRGENLTREKLAENQAAIHHAWRLHFEQVRRSLQHGFYQGWDLHPAQLPARFASVYSFFLQSLPEMSQRLTNFLRQAGQATRVGALFDDAATGQGILNFFSRGLNCGALGDDEIAEVGITRADLQKRSFMEIADRLNGK